MALELRLEAVYTVDELSNKKRPSFLDIKIKDSVNHNSNKVANLKEAGRDNVDWIKLALYGYNCPSFQ